MAYYPPTDANCQAWYRFDSLMGPGGDYSGKDNHLSNYNSVTQSAFSREGSKSAFIDGTKMLYRTDTNLSADFPLKYAAGNVLYTGCVWFYSTSIGTTQTIFAKYRQFNGYRTLAFRLASSKACFFAGYSGGNSYETITHGTTLSSNMWYHATLTVNATTSAYTLRILDTDLNPVGDDLSGTLANALSIRNEIYTIGAMGNFAAERFYGYIDDHVVFSRILDSTDSDAVAAQAFPVVAGGSMPLLHYYNRQARI